MLPSREYNLLRRGKFCTVFKDFASDFKAH